MSLTKNRLYLLKEVFTKVKYDELNERYYIALEDYGFLNLEPPQLVLLKNMCKENNIYLEELPKRLKGIETKELFEEYNQIKEKIKSNPNNKDNHKLEESLIEIRNKIIIGHMKLVYYLINKRIPELKDREDKEDIYQISYETLIEFFDIYNPEKDTSFAYFVKEYITHHIIYKIYRKDTHLNKKNLVELAKVKKAKQKLEEENPNYSIEDLIKETNIKKDRLKELLILQSLIETSSIDFSDEPVTDDLIDYDFEETMIDSILEQNNFIEKLVNLLPESERRIIRLYYGFEDGNTYTYEEISQKTGNISRERVRQLKESGLTLLANSTGSKYLKDIYGETEYTKKDKEGIRSIGENEKIIQDLMISITTPETVLSIINNFHSLNKEIMLLHYGLKDGIKYDIDEISKIINLRKQAVSERIKSSTQLLIKRIVKLENPNFKGDYLEYLMNRYLNTPNRKHK